MEYDFRKRPIPPYNAPPPMYRPATTEPPPSSSSSTGVGIRVAIKPEYRITPPPQMMAPPRGDIPRSNFQFEFDLEKKILAEAEKGNPNWSRLLAEIRYENLPSKPAEPSSSSGISPDPIVNKYLALGYNREAVPIAVVNYGDNPSKVKEYVNGYNLLREMGFSSSSVLEALLMFDNDTDKALAHFLNNAS